MALTTEEKYKRKRQRMIETATKKGPKYYVPLVAKVFQRMIRAEAGALPAGLTPTIVDGRMGQSYRMVGQCACVTCGKVQAWTSPSKSGMQTGHFLGSRCYSILLEEDNVAPQCVRCNKYQSGAQNRYRTWMIAVRGIEAVDRLMALKATTRQFAPEELVDFKLDSQRRLDVAEKHMRGDLGG